MFSDDVEALGEDPFGRLPEERQDAIMEAAAKCFAAHDYAKAKTDEIAREAGISKGLLFFYFKNKRALYLRVLDRLGEGMKEILSDERFRETDDFFELMEYAADWKSHAFRSMPYVVDFSVRSFYARHRDVATPVSEFMSSAMDEMVDVYLSHVRWDRFRDDVDPRETINMLLWLTDGYMHGRIMSGEKVDLDDVVGKVKSWLVLLKRASCKEEYL